MGLRYVSQILLVKNHKIVNNSTTTKAIEKISKDLKSVKLEVFDVCLTKFKNSQISHRFLLTTK